MTALSRTWVIARTRMRPVRSCRMLSSGEEPPKEVRKAPWYNRVFGMGKRQEEIDRDAELEDEFEAQERLARTMEAELREERLLRRQNKSRLHFSDRQMLRGLPPNVGLTMEWNEHHTTREHKGQLLGLFGRSKTGVDPSLAWPTPKEMEDQREYERVLYNDLTFTQMMEIEKNKVIEAKEAIVAK